MSKTYEYETTITDAHIDALGHVNNAKYLELMEEGRWDLARKTGLGSKRFLNTTTGVVILEIHIKYRKELKSGDKIRVISHFVSHNEKLAIMSQEIINEKGQVASKAEVTMALFDLNERKIVPLTPQWLEVIDGR